ncbi:hypothetical protein Slin14017_G127520 [Septoria linicola]|nr:hypothetical protein Slin14017_G127520 [Septoria linicola]
MALAYWFPDSDHAEDWVLTIGGYHPQFKKPAHYPDASRLGISWQSCMAGVRLQARFQMDSLSAHFETHADFLVNFEPFQFPGDSGVSIHVDYEIDYGVGHDTISVDVSAGLKLHGPPVGGSAFIDIHVFSTTIDFGQDYQPKPCTPSRTILVTHMSRQGRADEAYSLGRKRPRHS